MSLNRVELAQLIKPARLRRAGNNSFPVLSMTMHAGLVDQTHKFKKRVASVDTSQYKVVGRNQLVVGFPIDEGVLSFQELYDEAIVSPAYDVSDLRNEKHVGSKYLERFLRSPHALVFYASKLRGTTARRRTLPDDIFLSLRVPLPPLAEQQRIAEVLDRAEALQAKRRAALAQLDILTQSIFLDLFGDPIQNPRDFPVKPMMDLIDPERPISYGILMPGPDQDEGVKYVRVVDMKDGAIELSGIRKTTEKISNEFRRSLLKPADLLMSIRGHVGRFAVVPPELNGANITQDTARLAIRGASSIFVRECLRTLGFQRWMAKHTKGVAVRGINLGDVKLMPVILPPREDQDDFAHRAAAIAKLRGIHRVSLAKLDALFAVVQHRAFRGEL